MEGVQENEPNTVELKVDSTMTREEVVAKIFENIEKLSCWFIFIPFFLCLMKNLLFAFALQFEIFIHLILYKIFMIPQKYPTELFTKLIGF